MKQNKLAIIDALNRGFRKSLRFRTGSSNRVDLLMNPTRSRIDKARMGRVYGEFQPKEGTIVKPANKAIRKLVKKNEPTQSKAPALSRLESDLKTLNAKIAEQKVMSEVAINTACHPKSPVIKPPIAGPAMLPIPTNINIKPIERPLWFWPKASTAMGIEVP